MIKQTSLFDKNVLHKKWFLAGYRINPYFSINLKTRVYEVFHAYKSKVKKTHME